jgi:hypothetical protein
MLGEFLKSPETIKAFESLDTGNADLEAVVSQMRDAAVLVLSLTDAFTNQRVVTSDGEVEIADGGPGGNLTFSLSDTGVSLGNYGDASHLVQLVVNAKGRITLASSIPLDSDNVAEGVTNLFFTNARARSALSNGAGMAYNSTTGVIAAGTVLAAYAGGDTPSAFTLSIVDSADAAAWRTAIGAGTSSTTGTVTSVNVSGGTTGLTFSGGPVTTSGIITMAGTLAVSNGGTGVTTSTGTGAVVLSNNPSLVSPALGTPTSGTLTNCTGLPIASGVSGLASGIAIFLATPTSANLAAAVTDETGSGPLVFGSSPSLTTPAIASQTISGTGGNLYGGVYTPTLTNVANVDSSSAGPASYIRVGNWVFVSGTVFIDPTTVGVSTSVGISLPIASAFTAATDANGTAGSAGVQQSGAIEADATNDRAQIRYIATDASGRNMWYSYGYTII